MTTMPIRLAVSTTSDGRFKVKSPDVPGLFLASHDIPALCRDLEESTRDLLRLNLGLTPEAIEWLFV